ncbi:MAG: hypothetical protein RIS70_1096 [Planctomycetota bacterium]
MGLVIGGMAEHTGDRQPIADSALRCNDVDARVESFERHVLWADDYGAPGLVKEFDRVDKGLHVLFAGDSADEHGDFRIERETMTTFHFVAADERCDSAGIGAVGDDGDLIANFFGEILPHRLIDAHDLRAEDFVRMRRGDDERVLPSRVHEDAVLDVDQWTR